MDESERKCDICTTGIESVTNLIDFKNKKIKMKEFMKRQQKIGTICINCIYNSIKSDSKKARVYSRTNPAFKSLDNFTPIEVDENESELEINS